LSIITGLRIDHYAIIDMYAFIDVIDLIGGIDMYLYEPLTDPSYKTFDQGKWGTLSYERGWHHLSGVQALRLARSRATSSDFARAGRQQELLKAIQKKLNSLNVGDAVTITKMATTIISKTQMDLSLKTAMLYFFRFKNYAITPVGVLSTINVLDYAHQKKDDEETEEEKCFRQIGGSVVETKCAEKVEGQYILTPKKDWNAVRWYVRQLLNG
jgi:anionic cell wall polymer biosynthesis LytR-Cps2A-Psr (LCP) family protein